MGSLLTPEVGRLYVPEKVVFLPGASAPKKNHYSAVVSVAVRDGQTGLQTHGAFGHSADLRQGMVAKYQDSEDLQALFDSVDDYLHEYRAKAMRPDIKELVYGHNERVANGGACVAKGFWGYASSPSFATVAVPSYVALDKTSGFTVARVADQSLGNGVSDVAASLQTNEWTSNGLTKAVGTVGGYVAQTTLDGQFTLTVTFLFTCATGASTAYGAGLEDASSSTNFNLYAEAPFSSAALQIGDTLNVTWTVKD